MIFNGLDQLWLNLGQFEFWNLSCIPLYYHIWKIFVHLHLFLNYYAIFSQRTILNKQTKMINNPKICTLKWPLCFFHYKKSTHYTMTVFPHSCGLINFIIFTLVFLMNSHSFNNDFQLTFTIFIDWPNFCCMIMWIILLCFPK